MVAYHVMVGAVLFSNADTILMADRTLFLAPAGMRLPHYPDSAKLVLEYEILEGHNVLTHAPEDRV